jgi:uncharacterized protein YdbL (DUF1318 family)
MKKHGMIAAIFTVMLALPSFALDLHSARSGGLVGETPEGYVTALKPSAEVNALVADVNAKRKAEYERISKENGQPVDVVGKLAAPQIAKSMAAGN